MKDTLNFGSRVFRIELVEKLMLESEKDKKVQGIIDPQKCLIQIEKNMDPQAIQLTLWHEILHQLLGRVEHDGEEFINPKLMESLVENLADGIVLVLRLNPWLGDVK